jgi:hypothetical protein
MKARLTHVILLLNNVDNVRDFGSIDFRMQLADVVVESKFAYDKYTLASKESKEFKNYVEAKQAILKSCMSEPSAAQKKAGMKQSFNQDEFVKQLEKLNKQYSKAIDEHDKNEERLKKDALEIFVEINADPIDQKNIDKEIPLNMLTILQPFISKQNG